MQIFRGLEEWGRARAMEAFIRGIPTPTISAREAGESLAQNPSAKILLIGLYQKMGQFLCSTPLLRAFSTAWPQASLYFLGNPANAAAARANSRLKRVWIWNKTAVWEWGNQLPALRREHFDLALLLTTERPSATGVLLARATGARWVAGYIPVDADPWAKNAAALCHIRIPFGGEINEVEKYLGYARAFGAPVQGLRPEFEISPADLEAADSFLGKQPFTGSGPWVGLFIGGKAERSDRLWPESHFARLAQRLKESGLRVIVLSPPPPEDRRLEEFERALGWKCPVFQETSLGRVAAFIQRLGLLVCPDGGILHLAAAVGTPTVGLFFSTDPEVWHHDLRQVILDGRGKAPSELSPETVASEIQRFLAAATPS